MNKDTEITQIVLEGEIVGLEQITDETQAEVERIWYVETIQQDWNGMRDKVFEVGRKLVEARKRLPHGHFQKMIASELPFSDDTATKLMRVAKHPRFQNTNTVRVLPSSWGTLYELTTLNDEQFQKGIESGKINPDMTRKEVRDVKAMVTQSPGLRSTKLSGKKTTLQINHQPDELVLVLTVPEYHLLYQIFMTAQVSGGIPYAMDAVWPSGAPNPDAGGLPPNWVDLKNKLRRMGGSSPNPIKQEG